MATKPTVAADTATAEQDVETTLLDVQTAAVKRLIARGKERGYITFDELNAVLPPDQNSSEQIEDMMANLSEMGIQVVESEETEDGEAPVAKAEKAEEAEAEEADRQRRRGEPRPHRRPGAHVSARDGQRRAAVARGRDRHRQAHRGRPRHDDRRAVREPADLHARSSPGTTQLKAGRMLLRDIIDLEATQGAGAPAPDGSVAADPAATAAAASR